MKTPEAQKKLDSLVAEMKACNSTITDAESTIKAAEKRLSELKDGWHSTGEISMAKCAVRDSQFPILMRRKQWNGEDIVRIIGLTPKMIIVRVDGEKDDRVTYHSKETGWRRGARDSHGAIDAKKAIQIWETHLAENP